MKQANGTAQHSLWFVFGFVSVERQQIVQVERGARLLHQPAVISAGRQIGITPERVGSDLIQIHVRAPFGAAAGGVWSLRRDFGAGNVNVERLLKDASERGSDSGYG